MNETDGHIQKVISLFFTPCPVPGGAGCAAEFAKPLRHPKRRHATHVVSCTLGLHNRHAV